MSHADTPPQSPDELASRLRDRLHEAGSPSFSALTARIATLRSKRDTPPLDPPGRVTVYDCFREGRKRVDTSLVLDIIRALGGDDNEVRVWNEWCSSFAKQTYSDAIVTSRIGTPEPEPSFVGRETELRGAERKRRLLITGLGGAGKTQLANQILALFADTGHIHRAITVEVRGTDSTPSARPLAIIEAIERVLQIVANGGSLSDRAATILTRLGRERIGLLLDDVAEELQVRPLLRGSAVTPLIITSRRALNLPASVHVVELQPLSLADSITLLQHHIGSSRVSSEPKAAQDIIKLTGGFPLATVLIGGADRGTAVVESQRPSPSTSATQ